MQTPIASVVTLVVCFLLSVGIAVASIRTSAGINRRRAATILILLALGASISWIFDGTRFGRPRTVVLIYQCELKSAELEVLIDRSLGRSLAIRLLGLSTGQEEENCSSIQQELQSKHPMTIETTLVHDLPVRISDASGQKSTLMQKVLSRAVSLHKEIGLRTVLSTIAGQPTIVIAYSNTRFWREDLGLRNEDISRWYEIVRESSADVYVINTEAADDLAALSLDVQPSFLPSEKWGNVFADLRIRVRGFLGELPEKITARICTSIDGELLPIGCVGDGQKAFSSGVKKDLIAPPGRQETERRVTDPLIDFLERKDQEKLTSKQISPGWHRVESVAVLNDRVLPKAVRFFEAKETTLTFLIQGNEFSSDSWGLRVPPNPGDLLKAIWGTNQSDDRFRSAPWLKQECVIQSTTLNLDTLKYCLDRSSVFVMVEPSAQTLERISSDLVRRIEQDGLVVKVIVPPSFPSGVPPSIKEWLPGVAQLSPDSRKAKHVHLARRVVFIKDCSRLAKMPIDGDSNYVAPFFDDNSTTPDLIQDNLINGVMSYLSKAAKSYPHIDGITPGSNNISVSASDNDWQHPLFMFSEPLCLQGELWNHTIPESYEELIGYGQVDLQFAAFVKEIEADKLGVFPPVRTFDQYPNTVLVMLSTGAPQVTERRSEGRGTTIVGGLIADRTHSIPWRIPMQDLAHQQDIVRRMGLQLMFVELPANSSLRKKVCEHYLQDKCVKLGDWRTFKDTLRSRGAEIVEIGSDDPIANKVKQIAERILGLTVPKQINIERRWVGRVIDPRVKEVLPAPSQFVVLEPTNSIPVLGGPPALIKGLSGSKFEGVESPLILERRLGHGRVLVTSYSPFAFDTWMGDLRRDSSLIKIAPSNELIPMESCRNLTACLRTPEWTFHALASAEGQPDGWGAQTFLDTVRLTQPRHLSADRSILRSIEVLPDAATMLFRFSIPQGKRSFSVPPTLNVAEGKELNLVGADYVSNQITYAFKSRSEIPEGVYGLSVVEKGISLNTNVALSLKPRQITGSSSLEALTVFAKLTGGGTILHELGHAEQSAVAPVALLLAVLFLLMFSPMVKPWHAFRLIRSRMKRHRSFPQLKLDAEVVVDELGCHLGRVEAKRRAGTPAWIRRYESGDSLMRALTRDMTAFTDFGANVGLPTRPPKVRLRQIDEAISVTIMLDLSLSLTIPGDKTGSAKLELVQYLLQILVGAVTVKQGKWDIACLQESEARIGPFQSPWNSTLMEQIDSFIKENIHRVQHSDIGLPSGLIPGQVVFFLSDFMSSNSDAYLNVLEQASRIPVELRVIHIFDPEERKQIGIARDITTGVVFDRSEWQERDLDLALISARHSFGLIVDTGYGVYIEVPVDITSDGLLSVFVEREFFKGLV